MPREQSRDPTWGNLCLFRESSIRLLAFKSTRLPFLFLFYTVHLLQTTDNSARPDIQSFEDPVQLNKKYPRCITVAAFTILCRFNFSVIVVPYFACSSATSCVYLFFFLEQLRGLQTEYVHIVHNILADSNVFIIIAVFPMTAGAVAMHSPHQKMTYFWELLCILCIADFAVLSRSKTSSLEICQRS